MPGIQQPVGIDGNPKTLPTSTKGNTSGLDRDAFMKLMVAQLRYQDPSKPMDGSQFIAENAQFTNIELLEKVQQSQADMLAFQSVILSSGLVGKTVTGVALDGSTVSGKVDSAQVVAKNGVVNVGGKQIPVANISEVR